MSTAASRLATVIALWTHRAPWVTVTVTVFSTHGPAAVGLPRMAATPPIRVSPTFRR